MIAARPRWARAALSWEEKHDARFVRAVYGKDAQPFTVRDDAAGSLMYRPYCLMPALHQLRRPELQRTLPAAATSRWLVHVAGV